MTATLKFSSLPGAYERHLQRKCNNPLFPNAEQYLLAEEVTQARSRDQQDLQAFLTAFEQSVQQASKLTGSVDADVILELKQELERLYVHSCSLAGDLEQHRQALLKLLHVCMATIEKGASDDLVAIQKLRDENTARQLFFSLLETTLVADLLRGDEIIKAHELIPTLLSITTGELPKVLELFEPEQLEEIAKRARNFLATLSNDVVQTTTAHKNLEVIEKISG
jgi:hypothetical protein